MIFLYTFLLLLLAAAKLLIDRRAAYLERKFARAAKAADNVTRELTLRGGNYSKPDLGEAAKRYYLLGLLVQKRDRLEAKYDAWEGFAGRLQRWLTGLRNWKGKKLPYTLGVVDVSCLLYAIDLLGVGEYVSFRNLVQLVTSFLGQ